MNKKNLKKTVGFVILILLIVFCVKIYYVITETNKLEKKIQSLPPISFKKIQGDSIDSQKGRVIVYYFSPDCEHCQYMTQNLVKECDSINTTRFIMVTTAGVSSTKEFINLYHIPDCKSIAVYTDSTFTFNSIFGATIVPSFFVYENGLLVKKWVGETKIENLLRN